MKNTLLIIFTLLMSTPLFAQQNTDKNAYPKEGLEAFYQDFVSRVKISENVPEEVEKIKIKLRFSIEKDGSLSDFRVTHNTYGMGDEIVRVIKTMPNWEPAQKDGEAVKSTFSMPIVLNNIISAPISPNNDVYLVIDERARPHGGLEEFQRMLLSKIKINKIKNISPENRNISIRILFIVEKDGSISSVRTMTNPYGIGSKIVRALNTMPKWKPARFQGEPVRSQFLLPIVIRFD